jgi:hypothetical protein
MLAITPLTLTIDNFLMTPALLIIDFINDIVDLAGAASSCAKFVASELESRL